MTKFVISAKLETNKDLTIQSTSRQNQGENNCTQIRIAVPVALAEGYQFFLEFLCPKNKRYISPQLDTIETSSEQVTLSCDVPSCVLQEEGFVQFQLMARSADDNAVVYKSNYSNRTAFFVHASVNTMQTYTVVDYFGKVDAVAKQLALQIQSVAQMCDQVTTAQQNFGDIAAALDFIIGGGA